MKTFTCECNEGFEGELCEINTNDCTPGSCNNNGDCIDGVNTFTCQCYHGYAGESCEERVCTEDYCQNGGTCTKLGTGKTFIIFISHKLTFKQT